MQRHGTAIRTRRAIQFAALLLVIVGVFLLPGNPERWCPFGGLETVYAYFSEGNMPCSLGVSNLFIFAALLAMTLLLRRAFCSHLCPVGTISEWVHRLARKLGLRPRVVPRRLDRSLGVLKYILLAVILYFTYRTGELIFRGFDPFYALIGRHGEDITVWAYVVSGAILIGSVFVMIPFCRWLCPLAAILQPFSRIGLARIKRDARYCTDCGLCARVCPVGLAVDRARDVTAADCLACMECTAACPVKDEAAIGWGPPGAAGRRWSPALLAAGLVIVLGAGVVASSAFPSPSYLYERGVLPDESAAFECEVHDLTCRGRATLLTFFLDRDDLFAVPGPLRLEAWPAPGAGRVKISHDPQQTDRRAIEDAITEPYYDMATDRWHLSPFAMLAGNR
ncbi:MAG: 4Fe-4S binding protein [Candidatus Eisenbacteria sp.]|nr:4Fe-4S binding protein [Candidatus Eisenbacteria bacterium]